MGRFNKKTTKKQRRVPHSLKKHLQISVECVPLSPFGKERFTEDQAGV